MAWLQYHRVHHNDIAAATDQTNRLDWYENDGTGLAKLAIEHFIERGFRHFAYCDLTDTSYYRRRRFEQQLALRGFQPHVFHVSFAQREDWVMGRDRGRLGDQRQRHSRPSPPIGTSSRPA